MPSARVQPARPAGMPDDGMAGLSLESRVELSEKINVVPPSPLPKKAERAAPTKSLRHAKEALPHSDRVQTTDNCGRICSGSLHGPLLMEEAGANYTSSAAFSSEGFHYDSAVDFNNLRDACKGLATLSSTDVSYEDPGFLYVGTINGFANLVKDDPDLHSDSVGVGAVRLPNGQVGHISRSSRNGGEIRVRVPEESLDMLAEWGRTLLAIA